MVFSSEIFLFYFLPLALTFYYATPQSQRHATLTVCSYIFYGWANPAFALVMGFSTLVDYACGLAMVDRLRWPLPRTNNLPGLTRGQSRTRRQRLALYVSVTTNLLLLGYFKYFNFGIDTYAALAQATSLPGVPLSLSLRVALPLGISFYTFQSMSYSIDIYRGHARPVGRLADFACYVSMFPQLVAGPIVRFSEVADQLRTRTHTAAKFARGTAFFALGLAKKVLLANPCAQVADTAFDAHSIATVDAWWGVFAYSFQIYFDFSGYSNMAVGLGLMLGFVFPKNFDAPYRATSITEFWRRWHISLSTWLRDYLYVPLGGNRLGKRRTYINLGAVMLFGGLWHGASWNFVIWGAIHGGMLAVERIQGKNSAYRRLPRPVKICLTFVLVCVAWVFFRAPTMTTAATYLSHMLAVSEAEPSAAIVHGLLFAPYPVAVMTVSALFVWVFPLEVWEFTRNLNTQRICVVVAALLASIAAILTQSYNPFIYFIF